MTAIYWSGVVTPVGPDFLGVCANELAMPTAGGSLRWLGLLLLYRRFLRSRRMTSIMATTTMASATPSTAPGDSTNKETAMTTMTTPATIVRRCPRMGQAYCGHTDPAAAT